MTRRSSQFPLACLLVVLFVGGTSAHEMGVECKIRGPKVIVEAFFEDDTPARDASVVVRNTEEKVVAEGKTDDSGRWNFPKPDPGSYRVFVNAGDGHRARMTLTVPGEATPESPIPPTVESICEGECCATEAQPSATASTVGPWTAAGIGAGLLSLAFVGWGLSRFLRSTHP